MEKCLRVKVHVGEKLNKDMSGCVNKMPVEEGKVSVDGCSVMKDFQEVRFVMVRREKASLISQLMFRTDSEA